MSNKKIERFFPRRFFLPNKVTGHAADVARQSARTARFHRFPMMKVG